MTDNWNEENQRCLMAELLGVKKLLELHASRYQGRVEYSDESSSHEGEEGGAAAIGSEAQGSHEEEGQAQPCQGHQH
jgi:hypothetical protein